jgi:hypothetical protein
MGDPTSGDEHARVSRRVEVFAYGLGAFSLAGFSLMLLLLLLYNLARVSDAPVWPVAVAVVTCGLLAAWYVRSRTARFRPAAFAGLSVSGWASFMALTPFLSGG